MKAVQERQGGLQVAGEHSVHLSMGDGHSYAISGRSETGAGVPASTIDGSTRKRIRGMKSRFTGIDADLNSDSGEILRTYDPETQELLLDFPAGAFPSDMNRWHPDACFARDFTMDFRHDGTPESIHACAEQLVAYAMVRHSVGMPCGDLVLSDTGGFCEGTGRFVNPEGAVVMSLAGVAWSARNGIMPTVAELEIPMHALSESLHVDMLPGVQGFKTIPASETFKWRMSEAAMVLNRYSQLIRMMGSVLALSGCITSEELEMFFTNKRVLADGSAGWTMPLMPTERSVA